MSLLLQTLLLVVLAFAAVRACEAVARLFARSRARRRLDVESPSSPAIKPTIDEKDSAAQAVPALEQDNAQLEEMQLHKDLYFKLQNLEQYPGILPQSWDLLISLLSETVADAQKQPNSGILSLSNYTRESLAMFLQAENDKTTQQWEQYLARRKAGSPKEMFGDRKEAEWWLKQAAPVKYVDGAWLGHINKITAPFALRHITKNAWQVMSEELGDGDLSKNHVHVYRALMEEIDSGVPDGDTIDFIHSRHELNEPRVWKAALAQLLVSLFAADFLPEALGFNMAYEGLPLHLMKTVKELEELKLNPYYFVLHVSIDNADSGHAAMAMDAAVDYIEQARKASGDEAAHQAWKRVQAGFILAEGLPTTPESPSLKKPVSVSFPRNDTEAAVVKIFKAKAPVAHKIHCSSRLRIGRHTLVEWLEPKAFADKQWQMDFLNDLSNCRPWVIAGSSEKSRLIRELAWEGKMFGSFTQTEVEVVKRWIDELGGPAFDAKRYWSFTGREEITSAQRLDRKQDILCDYPVLQDDDDDDDLSKSAASQAQLHPFPPPAATTHSRPNYPIIPTPNLTHLLPLWFTHPCLLESHVSVPFKVATPTGSAIVRLLRAHSGFEREGPGVAGMDEVRRPAADVVGLVELGVEICRRAGIKEPKDLREVMEEAVGEGEREGATFARKMLGWSMRPMKNEALLLGLSTACVELHERVAASDLLSPSSRDVLLQIAERERESLSVCREGIDKDGARHGAFCRGYAIGRREVGRSFGEAQP
ncbi:hypothetical protein B0A49_14045 [Cryomyces minteri]|uniref:Uncharacterized protein n=2 Tax=Cryomyces minteri TaxID=331657 RepID=A0A4U0VKH8_9PEZI|nr:hypothetical protein B0A49_14045 [Cryomyces minteri]